MHRPFDENSDRLRGARCIVLAAAPGVLLALVTLLVCWPGIHGFWGRDDFPQLALVRMLDSPWVLFYQDHFFVPGSVFRPLGFASMWLGARLLGADYAAHAAFDIGMHVSVVLALYGVLRRAQAGRVVALPCSMLFALHPAVTGTAMWWSARFDLLATLCIMFSLLAAQAYCRRSNGLNLLLAAGAMLAAMLSKENGLIAVAAALAVWWHHAWSNPAWRNSAWRATGVAVLTALLFLLWRWAVLGTATSMLTGSVSLLEIVWGGLGLWLQQAPQYLGFWNRLSGLQHACLIVAAVGLASALACAWRRAFRISGLLLAGLCLLCIPVVLQAPIMILNAKPLQPDFSAVEAAMQSRLYYLGMAGLAMIVAALLTGLAQSVARWPQWFGCLAVSLAVLVFGTQAHLEARRFAQRSSAIADVARAASRAVSRVDLPPAPCHVALIGIHPPPEWSIYVPVDSMIKALAPNLARVEHCWFHSNYRSWFYLLQAPVFTQQASPYQPLRVSGHELPWRHVGNVVIALLDPASDSNPQNAQVVLQYRDKSFQGMADKR